MATLVYVLFVLIAGSSLGYIWIKGKRMNHRWGFSQLPPDPLFAHLRIMNKSIEVGRKGENPDYALQRLVEKAGSPSCLLIDTRPFLAAPLLLVTSHHVAEQITKPSKAFKYGVHKAPSMNILADLIGHTSIISSNEEDWKRKRKRFNPGFAPNHLTTLMPKILEMTKRFLSLLDDLADRGEEFAMESLTTPLTFDIIGEVVFNTDLQAQGDSNHRHPLFERFTDLTAPYATDNIISFNPYAKFQKWHRGKALDSECKALITQNFLNWQASGSNAGRSVLDLSFQGLDTMTPEMLQETADQIKSFLFAGHDTTSILLQWALYELARYPHAATILKQELDTVFGVDSDAYSVLAQLETRGEEAIKQLQYTSAIIKEVLRLYPPAGTSRVPPEGSNCMLQIPETGETICADSLEIYICHTIIGRDRKVYGDNADDFFPDRWLGNTDTGMEAEFANAHSQTSTSGSEKPLSSSTSERDIPTSAWRPFERGPRNCIGQELANIEARVILACTFRRYHFEKVGIGAFKKGDNGKPILNKKTKAYEVIEEMYNRRQITAKPIDDMRMKATLLETRK